MTTPEHSLSELRNLPETAEPRFGYLNSLTEHVQIVSNDIAQLPDQGGWGWSGDRRDYVLATGINDLVGAPTNAPAPTDTLYAGLKYIVELQTPISGAVTFNVGSAEGAVPVKKIKQGQAVDLEGGDLIAGVQYWFLYSLTLGVWTVIFDTFTEPFVPLARSFSAVKTLDQGIPSNNVVAQLTWQSQPWDTHNEFASHRHNPKRKGKYQYQVNVQHDPPSEGQDITIRLRKNNVTVHETLQRSDSGRDKSIHVIALIDMNGTTDSVDAAMTAEEGTTVQATSRGSYFQGYIVSE